MSAFDEPDSPAGARGRTRSSVLVTVLVALFVSVAVTLALNFIFVPSGVGWRKLQHEGTATVHGLNAPHTVHYPSKFTKPPSLTIEATQNGAWFWKIEEQTESYFVITNTTINAQSREPLHLQIRWKAQGARW